MSVCRHVTGNGCPTTKLKPLKNFTMSSRHKRNLLAHIQSKPVVSLRIRAWSRQQRGDPHRRELRWNTTQRTSHSTPENPSRWKYMQCVAGTLVHGPSLVGVDGIPAEIAWILVLTALGIHNAPGLHAPWSRRRVPRTLSLTRSEEIANMTGEK